MISSIKQYSFVSEISHDVFISACKAESSVIADPRTACFYARRTTELLVEWIYEHDNTLRRPYEASLQI